jgi:hypothetical protein
MRENLLAPTNITLFGRVFPLAVDTAAIPDTLGANRFLREQLTHTVTVGEGQNAEEVPDARFARIYAISYEGTFHHLARPAIFLVHGEGSIIRDAGLPARGLESGGLSDDSGLIDKDFTFDRSEGKVKPPGGGAPVDLEAGQVVRYWEYDKGDFTLRIDIASGTFEDVLLDAEVDTQLQIAGAGRVQTSGAGRVQTSGAGRVQMSHAGRMQMAHRSRD